MIRPILYVDLPGIIYAIDRKAHAKNGNFARFVCLPKEESYNALSRIIKTLIPFHPDVRTWICEDHWRIYGLAQARQRSEGSIWDLSYVVDLTDSQEESTGVMYELLEYMVDAAAQHGVHRIFAKIDDDAPEMEIFANAYFQRYAREITYCLPEIGDVHVPNDIQLRKWNKHDDWGLLRLYNAVTPSRVQIAEHVTLSEEYARLKCPQNHSLLSRITHSSGEVYVYDLGVRLGGWLHIERGHAQSPHKLSLMVHPENSNLTAPLLQVGLTLLQKGEKRPVICEVREYEGHIISTLESHGFEPLRANALLVRHLTIRAMRRHFVPAVDQNVMYGIKGFGTVNTHLYRGDKYTYATTNNE